MTTTDDMRDEGAWTWPCPYCRASNALEAAVCAGCGAQLRDPDEDDLFTTVATDNAQMVDPDAPRVKESLWSTEALPEEEVAEAIIEDEPDDVPPPPDPNAGFTVANGSGAQEGQNGADAPASGPFSATASSATDRDASHPPVFGAAEPTVTPEAAGQGQGPFRVTGAPAGPFQAPPQHVPEESWLQQPAPPTTAPSAEPPRPPAPDVPATGPRPTPDEHGLSVAVDSLGPADRDRCATPIAVCGALLADQEVVLALVAGHLLGHPAVVALTSTRVLVANARRWKPLVDQFLPGPDLMVHLRHDRDVASITFVQGDRLTGVDDIGDVTAAVDVAERIRATSARQAPG